MDLNKEKLIQVDISKEMRTSFLDYSMSVIVDRALPDDTYQLLLRRYGQTS